MNNRNRNEPLPFVEPEQNRTTAVRVNFFPISKAVFTTSIRRPFDGRSTAYQRSLRSQRRNPLSAVTLTYLFIYLVLCSVAAVHNR